MESRPKRILKIDSWDKAKKIQIIRSSPCGLYKNQILDKGVNYFILALEKIGFKTYYSCEGHFKKIEYTPQFYIVFSANKISLDLIRSILTTDATIEKEKYQNEYSIRISFKNLSDKISKLTKLSNKWNKKIGPIYYETI